MAEATGQVVPTLRTRGCGCGSGRQRDAIWACGPRQTLTALQACHTQLIPTTIPYTYVYQGCTDLVRSVRVCVLARQNTDKYAVPSPRRKVAQRQRRAPEPRAGATASLRVAFNALYRKRFRRKRRAVVVKRRKRTKRSLPASVTPFSLGTSTRTHAPHPGDRTPTVAPYRVRSCKMQRTARGGPAGKLRVASDPLSLARIQE